MKIKQKIKDYLLGFICFTVVGLGVLWKYNYQADREDRLGMGELIYQSLRNYRETPWEKDLIVCPFVGCIFRKTYHVFESDCALRIRAIDMVGFKNKEEAEALGYKCCPICWGSVSKS